MASQVDFGRERYGEQGSIMTGRPGEAAREELPLARMPGIDFDFGPEGSEKGEAPLMVVMAMSLRRRGVLKSPSRVVTGPAMRLRS